MHRSTKLVALLAASALVAAALAGCSGTTTTASDPAAATKKVKIGFAAPLTGDNAVYGQGMERAVKLAVKEANASAEVKKAGYEFVVASQDDQGDPKQAVSVANLIIGDKDVVGVVGHFNSGCSIPAAPVYNSVNMAMVSVSSNPQLTAMGLKNVNRIVAKDDSQGRFAGDMVAKDLSLKKVVVLSDSTPYGDGLAAEFVKAFVADGGTVLAQEKVQSRDIDFSALITRFKPLAPDAIYFGGTHTQGATLSKQAKDAGLKVPIIGGDMLFSPEYINLAGAAAAEGDMCTSLGLPLEQQPKGTEFKTAYGKEYGGKVPEAYDSYAYDSAWVFVRAVLKAGPDRKAVEDAIRTTEFTGVTGTFKFDANGDTTNQAISAYKVTGGKWEQILKK